MILIYTVTTFQSKIYLGKTSRLLTFIIVQFDQNPSRCSGRFCEISHIQEFI